MKLIYKLSRKRLNDKQNPNNGFMGLLAIGAAMYVPSVFGVVCVNASAGTVSTVASVAECAALNHGGSTTLKTTIGSTVAGDEKQLGIGGK